MVIPSSRPILRRDTTSYLSILLRRQEIFVQKMLDLLEQLHAVLLHDYRVRTFADLHVAFVRRVGQLREVLVEHVARQVSIPLGVYEKGGYADFSWIVQCLAGAPVLASVAHDAVRRAQHRG